MNKTGDIVQFPTEKSPSPTDRRWVPSQRTDARVWWDARRAYQEGAPKHFKSPLKGPTRGSENFAQNVGPWGGDFTVITRDLTILQEKEKRVNQ